MDIESTEKTDDQIRQEINARYAKVQAHNERMMTEAGVPTSGHSPRRGFYRVTASHQHYITKIERHDSVSQVTGRTRTYWIVNTSYYAPDEPRPVYTSMEHGWIIGQRGKVSQSW